MADPLDTLGKYRDALRRIRFSGARSTEYDGRRTEFKSDVELRQALSDLNAEIAAAGGGPSRISVVRIRSSKGV